MKNKKSILCFIAIAALSVAAFAFTLKPAAVSAATNRTVSYTDDFTGARLSDKWIGSGAELNCEYSALSLADFNLWGPSVNLVNHRVEKNSVITFEVINLGGGASWLGLAFGMSAPSSRVYYADGLIVMYSSANGGTMLMTKDGAELSQKTMNSHEKVNKTVFQGTNVKTTVVVKTDDNGDITLFSGVSGETLNEVIKFSGAFAEGYPFRYKVIMDCSFSFNAALRRLFSSAVCSKTSSNESSSDMRFCCCLTESLSSFALGIVEE